MLKAEYMQSIFHSTFFNSDILIGFLFLVMGLLIRWFPPKTKKAIYGYRSFLSTRNQQTWVEANRFAGIHSLRVAGVLIPLGLFFGFIFKNQSNWFYLLTVATVVIAAMNLRGETEWHLSRLFDENGEPRPPDQQKKVPALPPNQIH